VVSVETFVNPAPSPTNKPNEAVEVIEPVTSPVIVIPSDVVSNFLLPA